MVSITLSVPEAVRKKMKKYDEVNWSGLVRKFIEEKTSQLDAHSELLLKWEKEKHLTDWAVKLARKGRKGRYEELKRKGLVK